MGHDIYAYRTPQWGDEVAYLRRGAFQDWESKNLLYFLLKAENHNAGVSGDGCWEWFYTNEIMDALKNANSMERCPKDILDFLMACLRELSGNETMMRLGCPTEPSSTAVYPARYDEFS